VSLYDWLLFLHVTAAFALVGSLALFTAVGVALRSVDRPGPVALLFRIDRPANVGIGVGMIGTLAFGIWLAVYVDGYELWDGWILASLVLWAVGGAAGGRTGKYYTAARKLAERQVAEGRDGPSPELAAILRGRRGLVLHAVTVAAALAILVLMIFKPGG
jgi:uncharacterized membrane protein